MHVAVIGTGYVGLVVGAGLADSGNDVICADIDADKVRRLNDGEIPIYEPGLEPQVERNVESGRLTFTTDVGRAVADSEIVFIAVGTPPGEDGSADLKHVLSVARTIGENAGDDEKIVITKSTVPVGTADLVRQAILAVTPNARVHVCSNPEFLKEGAAVEDFMKPDRVVVGVDSEHARARLTELYEPFVRTGNPIIFMDIASAEITKYAANAMLATRISFMNMIARLCAEVGADVRMVRKGVGSDGRIGSSFLFAGVGYGGSCFPKDVKALIRTMRDLGVDASILEAVETVNEGQKELLLDAIDRRFGRDLSGRTFAVWGLAFKPETDDMREAPSLTVIPGLIDRGARVRAHDPVAMDVAQEMGLLPESVEYCQTNYEALEGADALIILTEWQPYRRPDFPRIAAALGEKVIFDGRNIYQPERMPEHGLEYHSIGRDSALLAPRAAGAQTQQG